MKSNRLIFRVASALFTMIPSLASAADSKATDYFGVFAICFSGRRGRLAPHLITAIPNPRTTAKTSLGDISQRIAKNRRRQLFPLFIIQALTAVLWIAPSSSVFGCDQTLNVVHGQDVGWPNSYGIFTWDDSYVYENESDTNPTFVRGVDLPAGTTVIDGVNFTRNDVYYDNTYDGNDLFGVVHHGTGCDGLCAGPSYQIYLNSCPATTVKASKDKPDDKKEPLLGECTGMARYTAHLMLASLNIEDTPIGYSPQRGPAVKFTVTYNQRHTAQPSTFSYSNLGPKWTFNWLSYVIDNPADGSAPAGVYVPGGGIESYSGFNTGTQSYAADPQSFAVLVRITSTSYERRLPDGSKQIFSVSDGATGYPRKIFMTQVADPAGNAVSIGYDSSFRITTLTDALGQITTLSYELIDDPLKITKVSEPFPTGRTATFSYTNGQLTTITDQIGIQSEFHYASGTDFIDSLTTPYGTSTFTTGQNGTNAWIEMTDPLGGKERVEYRDNAPGIGANESLAPSVTGITNIGLDVANSFYWDKKAIAMYPPVNGVYDYTKARITHWAYNSNGFLSGIPASEKAPLESRVWYIYTGQPDSNHVGAIGRPNKIARVLDDGTTQLSQFTYNTFGKVTQSTDPVGRVLTYDYDTNNNIDLLTVRQTRGANNELLRTFTYNTKHEPLTDKDAAGQMTNYGYNSFGQLTTVQNAKLETTTYSYGDGSTVPVGHLASITSPLINGSSGVINFSYDNANRTRTITSNPDGYSVTIDYDELDRRTKITYPDGTYQQFKYTEFTDQGVDTGKMLLDLTQSRDRRNQWTYRHHDANRRMDWIKDPLLRKTIFSWCNCGALGAITDANSHTTTFNRDLQSRVTSKVFADTKSISYSYENTTSRLKSMTDAKNQVTNYQYFADSALKQISYTNTAGQPLNPPTPTANFTYDPNYKRIATILDGTGTTTYTYKPITGSASLGAGQLQFVDGPLANDTITYSYDELGRELSELINGVNSSQTYDALGRVSSATNPLGVFINVYDGPTRRLQSMALPNGQSTTYSYFGNSADRRLQTILNTKSGGAILSKFDYVYDPEGEITSLSKQLGAAGFPETWNPTSPNNSMLDAADQLTNLTSHPSADVYASVTFGYDSVGNRTDGGAHTFNLVNQLTDSGYSYDNNGNLTADIGRTYTWDAGNRLIKIEYPAFPGWKSEFTYDGLGRRVKIVEWGLPVPLLDWMFQPTNTNYRDYSTANFSVSAGTYSLTLQGLNPNGGDNTALLDAVKLLKNTNNFVTNGGFETPGLAAGTYQYNPSGATWLFSGTAGISRNNSGITSGNPAAPAGTQIGFVQMNSSIAQSVSLTAGTYSFTVKSGQRTANPTFQQVRVTLQSPTVVVTSTKQFIWSGNCVAEERDANNLVTRRFYPQGEQINGINYFYTRDHLGSVTELTDSTGAVRAEYYYDWWGNRIKRSGDLEASFGFTGHYYHGNSGLSLALFRAYNAATGRWISRDPIGEAGGLNLYTYVLNRPLIAYDPLGLDIVINNTGAPVMASGNPTVGPGIHGDGSELFFLLPPGGPFGGRENPVLGYADRTSAILGYLGFPLVFPTGLVEDIDHYDDNGPFPAEHCQRKMSGDSLGPVTELKPDPMEGVWPGGNRIWEDSDTGGLIDAAGRRLRERLIGEP